MLNEIKKSNYIRENSVYYMIYWIDRLKNNTEEQNKIIEHFNRYVKETNLDYEKVKISNNYDDLLEKSKNYVKNEIVPVETVDLVIEKMSEDGEKQVLLYDRPGFMKGIALPGGIVDEDDKFNKYGIEPKIFTALRVAGEKILNLSKDEVLYSQKTNNEGENYYVVSDKSEKRKIIIHPQQIYGHAIKENLKAVLRPSDVRHLVDTVGFKCEIVDDEPQIKYFWENKKDLLNGNLKKKKLFAFNHHKEIILHTLAKTTLEEEINFNETNFVKNIIKNPSSFYNDFTNKCKKNNFNPYMSFPELFTVVNKLLNELFTDDINKICDENKVFLGFRDKVVNSLRHVSLKNRTFCPYLPTLHAIFDTIAFFDVVARHKRGFYDDLSSNKIIEHNPKNKKDASYHMYRYEYRKNELLSKIPDEIIIPTFTNLSATDLIKIRGIPVRFVGLSKDFLYVDEFEQSPEEFLMHDINHSYRMSEEDKKVMEELGIDLKTLTKKQQMFLSKYLDKIIIKSTDSEKTKEMKKLKKIILFEICHEDAKPCLPEIILSSLLQKEGGEVRFELPTVDHKTGYMDVIDTLDTGISTLSYVRNKLQCGFYDKIDSQNNHIVGVKYRKSEYIAEAAMEMVREMSFLLHKKVTVDYDYLLKRTCSVGPDNIHESNINDEMLEKYADGAEKLNPKRYLAGT